LTSQIRSRPGLGGVTPTGDVDGPKKAQSSSPPATAQTPLGPSASKRRNDPEVGSAKLEGLRNGLAGLGARLDRLADGGEVSTSDKNRIAAWAKKLSKELDGIDRADVPPRVAEGLIAIAKFVEQRGDDLGLTASLAPLSQLIAAPTSEYTAAEAVVDLHDQFDDVFRGIKHAESHPAAWTDLATRDDYKQLLLQLKFHVTGASIRPAPPIHDAVIDEVIECTGMMRAELDELTTVPSQRLHRGKWMPTSARMLRLADDALTAKSDDRILRALDDASNQHMPDVARVGLGPLTVPYFLADKALPVIDKVGKFTEQKVLEVVARWLDSLGDGLRSDIQMKYRELGRSLTPLGVKRKDLESGKYSESDKQMITLAAATLGQSAKDVDAWMTLLDDPSKAQDEGFWNKTVGGVRTSLDAAAWLIHGTASKIHTITDEESWSLFSLRGEVGAGIEIAGCTTRGGWAFIFPSLAEYRLSEHPEICIETLFTPIASPIGNTELTSRGGKYAFSAGPFNVRDAEFSQAVNAKLQGIGGVAFQRDKVLGPGFEAGASPAIGLVGVFNIRAGGEVAIFHPGMNAWDRPVNRAATILGNATEAAGDAIVGSYGTVRDKIAGPKEHEPMELKKLRKKRLGRSSMAARKASISLGVVQGYREQMAAAKAAGASPFAPDSPAYREMTRGYSEDKAIEIIETFLGDIEGRLTEAIDGVREWTDDPIGSPWEERNLRGRIRVATKTVAEVDQIFSTADTLLSGLFAGTEWAPAGPFADLVDGEKLTGVALSEARADAAVETVTLAMSYGALDWVVTESEALKAFATLDALDEHGRIRALDKLEPKSLKRLIKYLPADNDLVTPQLYSDLHEAADR